MLGLLALGIVYLRGEVFEIDLRFILCYEYIGYFQWWDVCYCCNRFILSGKHKCSSLMSFILRRRSRSG